MGNGSFYNPQRALHVLVNIAAIDSAKEWKSAGFVCCKGGKNGFSRLDAVGYIYVVCFEAETVFHITAT